MTAVPNVEQPNSTSSAASDDDTLMALSLYTRRRSPTFTSDNQRSLLGAVLNGRPECVIAVLPTGSGKSIAIFGPILVESSGITIVITPYTALRSQLAEQAHSFGIKFLNWCNRHENPNLTSMRLVIMITDDFFSNDAQL